MEKTTDNRRARSEATQSALMRAAEKLIADRGVENISIREIVAAAGQKNESALQYHFKNISGLLTAIHAERALQVQQKRSELLQARLSQTHALPLRQLCWLMVEPTFELAKASVEFRRYIKAFGQEFALAESSPLRAVSRQGGGGESGQQIGELLQKQLPHLDTNAYQTRMEAAILLCSTSMYRQARQTNAFRGKQANLFIHHLVDALVGLLSAPVSTETKALKN